MIKRDRLVALVLLIVACITPARSTPGEAKNLIAVDYDDQSGQVTINYTPACDAADHHIEFGPLNQVHSYAYSGQACALGPGGSASFAPGSGSFFFMVVGDDGVNLEGSYGRDGVDAERPEDVADPTCSRVQNLIDTCDPKSCDYEATVVIPCATGSCPVVNGSNHCVGSCQTTDDCSPFEIRPQCLGGTPGDCCVVTFEAEACGICSAVPLPPSVCVPDCTATIDNCTDLPLGTGYTFTATVSPTGGTYEWQVQQPSGQLSPISGSSQIFPVTAQAVSEMSKDVIVLLTYTDPSDNDCEDSCLLTVFDTDLDIDTDNDNGFEDPDRSMAEEADEEVAPGKYICVNKDDDDNDQTRDLDQEPLGDPPEEDDAAVAILEIAPNATPTRWRLTYPAGLQVYHADGSIIVSGQPYDAPIDPHPMSARVEGLAATDSGDAMLTLELDTDGDGNYEDSDTVVSSVIDATLQETRFSAIGDSIAVPPAPPGPTPLDTDYHHLGLVSPLVLIDPALTTT
ncbi:MAG: hypothetical protein GY716_04640 [bacterium]|nr:hypothetical protein [bacterium]